MIEKKNLDKEVLSAILFSLSEASFCSLGRGAAVPFRGF